MTNEEIVKRIKSGEDTAGNMLALWLQNKAFIAMIARKYAGHAEMEDMEQEGYIALCDAVEHYDPEAGSKFLTYAEFWIRQGLLRYVENFSSTVRIPFSVRKWHGHYKRLTRAYFAWFGRNPSEREISGSLGLTAAQVKELEMSMELDQIGSLDSPLSEEGSETTIGDMVPGAVDVEGEVLERVEFDQMKTALWDAVAALPDRERDVIRMRYQGGKTRKEIGEAVGESHDKVNRLEQKALRSLAKSSQLKPFLPEVTGSSAYRHNSVSEFNRTWTSSTEFCAMRL